MSAIRDRAGFHGHVEQVLPGNAGGVRSPVDRRQFGVVRRLDGGRVSHHWAAERPREAVRCSARVAAAGRHAPPPPRSARPTPPLRPPLPPPQAQRAKRSLAVFCYCVAGATAVAEAAATAAAAGPARALESAERHAAAKALVQEHLGETSTPMVTASKSAPPSPKKLRRAARQAGGVGCIADGCT
jgi:hypothetical protein